MWLIGNDLALGTINLLNIIIIIRLSQNYFLHMRRKIKSIIQILYISFILQTLYIFFGFIS